MSLSRQSRVDPETEKRYNLELGTYIYCNLGLIEVREYCDEFIQKFTTSKTASPANVKTE